MVQLNIMQRTDKGYVIKEFVFYVAERATIKKITVLLVKSLIIRLL